METKQDFKALMVFGFLHAVCNQNIKFFGTAMWAMMSRQDEMPFSSIEVLTPAKWEAESRRGLADITTMV